MLTRPLLCLLLAGAMAGSPAAAFADDAGTDPPGRVGVLSLIDGQLQMQPAGSQDWIADVQNRPLGAGDRLWVDARGRAELKVGSITAHLGQNTGIEFLALDDSRLQLRLSAGTLRLNVRRLDPGQAVEVDTPGGAVTVLRPGLYRVDVADGVDDVRVSVQRGQAEVANARLSTVLATGQLVELSGAGDAQTTSLLPPDDFDAWAAARDQRDEHAVAARYVSREVPGYAQLDDYGDWVTDPTYGAVWIPRVAAGFVPYGDGHWSWISTWGWTWIDAAPWGFVPFHYGRWARLGGRWGWCPGPLGRPGYYAPALVGWIGGGGWNTAYGGRGRVGWFPLGWNEVYVPGYRASATYARELNLANTQLTRTYLNNTLVTDNYRSASGQVNGARYANQQVAGAVTVVPRETLLNAARVGAATRTPSGVDYGHLPAQATAPPLGAPMGGAHGIPTPAPANAALFERAAYARNAPPIRSGSAPAPLRLLAAPPQGTVVAPPVARPPLVPSGGVYRAYADRPPYAQHPAPTGGRPAPYQGTGERQRADRPWSAPPAPVGGRPEPAPVPFSRQAPPPAAPPAAHPASPSHPTAPGRPQHMGNTSRAPSLPRHVSAAYHAWTNRHTMQHPR